MGKLLGQREFTLDAQVQLGELETIGDIREKIYKRNLITQSVFTQAHILGLVPTKGMFVACDKKEGNILLPPGSAPIYTHSQEYLEQWREANKSVRFAGFSVEPGNISATSSKDILTITNGIVNIFWKSKEEDWHLAQGVNILEDLVPYQLELTEPNHE